MDNLDEIWEYMQKIQVLKILRHPLYKIGENTF